MIPYLLLILIPGLFCFMAWDREKKAIMFGNNNEINDSNLGLPIFFISLFFLLAFRSETLGRDLPNYKCIFEVLRALNYETIFSECFKLDGEILFVLLNKIVGSFTNNFHTFLVIVAAITIIPEAIILSNYRQNSLLQIILFVSLSFLSMYFSGIRQSIAMSLGVIAYFFCKEKKIIPYLIVCIIALGFHHTAFVLFLMYPVFHTKINIKSLFIVIPLIIFIFIFNKHIFTILTTFLSEFSIKYESGISNTSAYGSLILFILFAVFCVAITINNQYVNDETNGLRNIIILTVIIQLFAPLNSLSMRMNYYYMIFIPRGISMCISNADEKGMKIAQVGKYVIITFFLIFYIKKVFISSLTGIGDLDIFPYVPYWR